MLKKNTARMLSLMIILFLTSHGPAWSQPPIGSSNDSKEDSSESNDDTSSISNSINEGAQWSAASFCPISTPQLNDAYFDAQTNFEPDSYSIKAKENEIENGDLNCQELLHPYSLKTKSLELSKPRFYSSTLTIRRGIKSNSHATKPIDLESLSDEENFIEIQQGPSPLQIAVLRLCCIGSLGSCMAGFVLLYYQQMDASSPINTGLLKSQTLRLNCRQNAIWIKNCNLIDSQACLNKDFYEIEEFHPQIHNQVTWHIGPCGQWENFTHSIWAQQWECQKMDGKSKCGWAPFEFKTNDLSELMKSCPNFSEYQKEMAAFFEHPQCQKLKNQKNLPGQHHSAYLKNRISQLIAEY